MFSSVEPAFRSPCSLSIYLFQSLFHKPAMKNVVLSIFPQSHLGSTTILRDEIYPGFFQNNSNRYQIIRVVYAAALFEIANCLKCSVEPFANFVWDQSGNAPAPRDCSDVFTIC
jgi:hypothetical protein